MKRFINRRNFSNLLYYSGILHLLAATRRYDNDENIILMGHRIVDPETIDNTDEVDEAAIENGQAITPAEFDRRVRFVRRIREPDDPKNLISKIKKGYFYITFDDGYRDNIANASKILHKYNLKAIIFIISELTKNHHWVPWWDGLSVGKYAKTESSYADLCKELKSSSRGIVRDKKYLFDADDKNDMRYLTSEELADLSNQDTFYIGNHTCTHPNLLLLSEEEIDEEIDGNTQFLNSNPRYLPIVAYPFGYSNEKVRSIMKNKADVKLALATGGGRDDDIYQLRRINLNTQPRALFYAECLGIFNR